MHISKSRKSTNSIMNHQGYGNIKIILKTGTIIELTADDLTKNGAIKKITLQRINSIIQKEQEEKKMIV